MPPIQQTKKAVSRSPHVAAYRCLKPANYKYLHKEQPTTLINARCAVANTKQGLTKGSRYASVFPEPVWEASR